MKLSATLSALALALYALPSAHASLVGYGICQTGCNTLAVACYAAAGFTFGTVTAGAGTPAAILACNVALGYRSWSGVAYGASEASPALWSQ
ncbi:hypothetical protein L227DRAFT_372897 [Lentinus tigrinus ALCF2SS1-6]|uniref:Cysteine-rich protein n=1 Tax=Lentinus tigrinus ALCF2SS1-6 TaxID=1328759 RepID=A0A5C2RU85_9APHY|nr:hypothetical protein L227DRAFT_372897 [Lentinus tigrinus ALCF2SS1-6]